MIQTNLATLRLRFANTFCTEEPPPITTSQAQKRQFSKGKQLGTDDLIKGGFQPRFVVTHGGVGLGLFIKDILNSHTLDTLNGISNQKLLGT